MKIVFIGSRSLSYIGGIENYMANLCPTLVKNGHEIILYTAGEKNTTENYSGVKLITIKSTENKIFNKIILGWKSTSHALKHHKDADFFHYNAMAAGLSSWRPLHRKIKVVFQGHGFEWQRAKWSPLSKKIIRILDNFCLKINKYITMVSQDQTKYVKNRFNKECQTITPGINLPPKDIKETDILKTHGLESDNYILYLGRLVPEKKADILINAYLNLNITNTKLVIAGDDPNAKTFIAKCKKLGKQSKNIIFTGAVYTADKDFLLSNCKIFVMPSELEGLPITLLEAMSYSKPCLASNIPACKEALGNNGVYFNVNDVNELASKLVYMLEGKDDLTKRGELNYIRVKEQFTWQRIAQQYEQFLQNIINSNKQQNKTI